MQFFIVLKGWIKFIYEGQEGELEAEAGGVAQRHAGFEALGGRVACTTQLPSRSTSCAWRSELESPHAATATAKNAAGARRRAMSFLMPFL